jgi:sugar phosphate isomerase/epimerase
MMHEIEEEMPPMPLTADAWPIAAALLPLDPVDAGAGDPRMDLERAWAEALLEVADAGFDAVDLTDTWLKYGDLGTPQVRALRTALSHAGLAPLSMSVIRRSVIDERHGDENLAYTHRSIDVAAELGVGVVSVGLHRPLTAEQRGQLWFWSVPGHRDRMGDPEAWALAVARFRQLGRHAEDVGVLLSLELYEHTFLGTAESSVRLVEDIGSASVGLNPDIGNLIRLHEPVESWRKIAEATMPYANFWHVKNYHRDENPGSGSVTTSPSYLEDGVIDYRTAVRIAVDAGFQGVICTEHYGGDGLSVSAANRDYLRMRVLPRRPRPIGTSRVRQQYGGDAG